VRESLEEGEPPGARCDNCPIRDYGATPKIDALSLGALRFSLIYDHPAHEGYREAVWDLLGPVLGPAEAVGWLQRRSAVYEVRMELAQEQAERNRRSPSDGRDPSAAP
jgi:hypothetical protein